MNHGGILERFSFPQTFIIIYFFSPFFVAYIHILYTYKSSDTSCPNDYDRLLGNKFHRCIRLIKFPVERFSPFPVALERRSRNHNNNIILYIPNAMVPRLQYNTGRGDRTWSIIIKYLLWILWCDYFDATTCIAQRLETYLIIIILY